MRDFIPVLPSSELCNLHDQGAKKFEIGFCGCVLAQTECDCFFVGVRITPYSSRKKWPFLWTFIRNNTQSECITGNKKGRRAERTLKRVKFTAPYFSLLLFHLFSLTANLCRSFPPASIPYFIAEFIHI